MNEDDTFRILKRPSFEEVMKKGGIFGGYIWEPFEPYEIQLLERYSWSELEFKKAWKKYVVDTKPANTYFWDLKLGEEIKRLEKLNDRG